MGSYKIFAKILKNDSHNAKFPDLLHFVKCFRNPWILKWQYDRDDNVLTHHWYVKWWDKFAYVQSIIDNVTRELTRDLTPKPLPKQHSPAQIAPEASAPSTSSTRRTSHFDNLTKDDLYALLKQKIKEEELAANKDLDEEGSIAKSPYYPHPQPYPQDWFAHDQEDTPDLGAI